ncbi:hypothetical protein ACVBEH_03790 [Roseateles sp. GG27B]
MNHVAIVGVGQTHHQRRRADVNVPGLVREAVKRALADANLSMDDIDSVVVASGPVLFAAVNQPEKWVVDAIGARGKPVVRITSGGGTGFAGALAAYYQVVGGFAGRVLVVAYDKLSEGALQYSISSLYDPFWGREFAVGIMGFSAAYWRARMDALGHTEEAAAQVVVKNLGNAHRNPFAHVRKTVTVEDVLKSAPLAWPIKLLDAADLRRRCGRRALERSARRLLDDAAGHHPRHCLLRRGRQRAAAIDADVRAARPCGPHRLPRRRHHQSAPSTRRGRGARTLQLL